MKHNRKFRQQETSQQGPPVDKKSHSKLLTLFSAFLIAFLALASCRSWGRREQATSTNQSAPAGTPNPEIERQKQQVAEISARCEAIRKEAADAAHQSVVALAKSSEVLVDEIKSPPSQSSIFERPIVEDPFEQDRARIRANKQGHFGIISRFPKSDALLKKSDALRKKADKLMGDFKTCEGELRTLAQSDNADVKREADLALKNLEEKLNEQKKQKDLKAASSKK